MINFVDIHLQDVNYLPQHDHLDEMIDEGWQIIGHSIYTDHEGETFERYTLHKPNKKHQSDTPETVEVKVESAVSLTNQFLNSGNKSQS